MNAHYLKYFIKDGLKNLWSNSIMSAASILVMTCCMILTGGAMLISLNINKALESVEHQNSMTVFLKKDITDQEVAEAGKKIAAVPNILKCDYYPSEKAIEKYKDVLGELYEIVEEGENPFPEAYHITMEDLSLYNKTISKIKAIPNVESASDRSETAKKLSDFNRLVGQAGIWIVCSLGIVSLFIISNTIKITMHSRRFKISIMKSVGATNGFIRAPFIIEGMAIGIISAIISTVILYFVYNSMFNLISGILPFHSIAFTDILWQVLGIFTAAGILFGVVGGLISIKRYLSKEGGEVVAW
ncbi:MAG: permease-like cell division protein FtsX [Clostridia bacterium]|nr:permease-like cell division protein FtsX [Clostridia bacterium]